MGKLTMPRILRITNMKMMINFNTNNTSTLHEVTRNFHRAMDMWMGLVENMSNSSIVSSIIRQRSNTTSNSMWEMVWWCIGMTICGDDNEVELGLCSPCFTWKILHFLLALFVWRVWFTVPFLL